MFVNVLCCKVLVGVTLLSQSSNLLSQFCGVECHPQPLGKAWHLQDEAKTSGAPTESKDCLPEGSGLEDLVVGETRALKMPTN